MVKQLLPAVPFIEVGWVLGEVLQKEEQSFVMWTEE